MALFYVRPPSAAGYGSGDGTSFDNAFNGFESIDWDALAKRKPCWLTICGAGETRQDLLTVQVEWTTESATTRLIPRRESAQPV